jgi:hypothetical protein
MRYPVVIPQARQQFRRNRQLPVFSRLGVIVNQLENNMLQHNQKNRIEIKYCAIFVSIKPNTLQSGSVR